MTLPSGAISMSQVAAELNLPATGLSLNHSWVRLLANEPSGAVDMGSLRGKTGRFDGPLATDPTFLSVNFSNAPFFNSRLNTLQMTFASNPSPEVDLFINSPISWQGPILVINNSTGVQARLTVSSVGPSLTIFSNFAYFPNLIRAGATADSFTVLPWS